MRLPKPPQFSCSRCGCSPRESWSRWRTQRERKQSSPSGTRGTRPSESGGNGQVRQVSPQTWNEFPKMGQGNGVRVWADASENAVMGGNGRGALIFRRCQGCLGIPAEKFHDFLTLAKPLLKQQGQRLRVGGLAGGSSQASGWLMAVGSLKESKASSRRYRERKTSSAFLFCSSESAVKPSSTSTRTDTS